MAWVVDTSVLLDVHLRDRSFGVASATCLVRHLSDGLIVCPVSYVEMSPAFRGDHGLQRLFLRQAGVNWMEPWKWQDTEAAYHLWAKHIAEKRVGHTAKRPLADVFIEAYAQRFQGLITRNPAHFSSVKVVTP